MPELPENLRTLWLFPDNLVENSDYKFLNFIPEFTTTNNKKIPVFLLWGKLKVQVAEQGQPERPEFEGELLTTIWNIYNYKELIKQLGKNTDNWDKNLFFKLKKEHDKIVMLPVETIQSPLEKATTVVK